ncbi:MAG: 23S rRNA (adenine(2030)-N(6))-methyltransferase RlmJ [Burkholderiales bacterium]
MLSYRHLYHAGNFADVFKHALLTRLLIAVASKDKPYCYLDTHAGIGRYDLTHAWAQKAREYETGIARVWKAKDIPPALEPYVTAVRELNPDGKLRFYPGSPLIARRFVRPGDRMVLTELNKTDHAELAAVFSREKRVAVQLMDAYQALKAYLPPAERRGLVLVDSAFDRAREFERLARAPKDAHARWTTGLYAVWYPMMEPAPMRDFYAHVARSGMRKVLRLELVVRERDESAFIPGCGMLVVNPPWRLEEEAQPMLAWLAKKLAITRGASHVDWLVPE